MNYKPKIPNRIKNYLNRLLKNNNLDRIWLIKEKKWFWKLEKTKK